MKTKLVIFDFDGTLGDTRQTIVTTMQMTIAELGLSSRTDDACAAQIGLPLQGCFRALFPDVADEVIQQCADTYRRLFAENVRNITPKAFPKVVETLSTLKSKGYTLTIASSRSHASLVELSRSLLIADYISYMIGADDVSLAKPHPEPVLNTLAAMNFSAAETLVVGDMAVDVQMGAGAGCKTCGVTWGNGTKEDLAQAGADFIINDMEELLKVVAPRNLKTWLQSLSFKTGVIVLLCCIPFYIASFAQMLLPISAAAKGVLWTILFGMAKTCQYGGLTILGVEGYQRVKNWVRRKRR